MSSDEPTDIRKISPDVLIEILVQSGMDNNIEEVEAMLLNDISGGFELNEDGTLDVLGYCAWLVKETK